MVKAFWSFKCQRIFMRNKCLLPCTKALILAIFNFLNFIKRKVTSLAFFLVCLLLIFSFMHIWNEEELLQKEF